jgi:beta-galactosidase
MRKCNFLAIVLIFLAFACIRTEYSKPLAPILFNDNWQFVLSADSATVFSNNNNLQWETVNLPHTPVIEPLIINDQWQGTCWYKKEFVLPGNAETQNVASPQFYLRFEGAMNVTDIWINGVHKIHHLGGFLPFVIDFTQEARSGQPNTIIVKLDNTDNPITGPKPLKILDFNMYGGLYRDVFLIIENPVHITDPIFENTAHAGIFVTYPDVTEEKAVIQIANHVRNAGNGDAVIINPGSTGLSEAGVATALIRIGDAAGEIQISAEAKNLAYGTVDFVCK